MSQSELESSGVRITDVVMHALNRMLSENAIRIMERDDKFDAASGNDEDGVDGPAKKAKVGKKELVYCMNLTVLDSLTSSLSADEGYVYQRVMRAHNNGIWTKDIKTYSGLPTQTLTKIYKKLETLRLVKTVKSVASKSKKLYMGYDIVPSRAITGGPWYNETDFDFEFIGAVSDFIATVIRKKGPISVDDITRLMVESEISKENLTNDDVEDVLKTLLHDKKIERDYNSMSVSEYERYHRHPSSTSSSSYSRESFDADYYPPGSSAPPKMYVSMNPGIGHPAVSHVFKYWEALEDDFDWREIQFGDNAPIAPHEAHHHT